MHEVTSQACPSPTIFSPAVTFMRTAFLASFLPQSHQSPRWYSCEWGTRSAAVRPFPQVDEVMQATKKQSMVKACLLSCLLYVAE